jgi:putative ABC transport system substrate-binding protein
MHQCLCSMLLAQAALQARRLVGLVLSAILLASGPAYAQRVSGNPARVGWVSVHSLAQVENLLEAFRDGLAAHGLMEGKNLEIVARSADGVRERMPSAVRGWRIR